MNTLKPELEGVIIPYTPYSDACVYTATVDPTDQKRVRIRLSGRTENGLKELESIERAELLFQNDGGYMSTSNEYGSDSSESYYWTFPPKGVASHFTISDGAGNPFRITFEKKDSKYFEFECEFFAVFGEKYDYNPNGNYIFIDYLMRDVNARMKDHFTKSDK